jgi:two-component system, cell cycle sensor histidine kinase and response regulator CckA
MGRRDSSERRTPYFLILIFAILASGIVTAEHFHYRRYAAHYRTEVEHETSRIAELKVRAIAPGTDVRAVQAVRGHEGIVEGPDYRGVPVIAAVRAVPESPWFLSARMDVSEAYAPLGERWWVTVVAALLVSAAASVALLWWRQHSRLYQELSQASVALREGAAFNRDVLDSLTANVAVLDVHGTITAVNERWRRFARANWASLEAHDFVGVNYLAVCEKSVGMASDEGVHAALAGIRAVMDGSQMQFSLEYPCHSPGEQRWFLMHVSPLGDSHGGVVVAHQDITERKQAEGALAEVQARLATIVDSAMDGIVTIDDEERILVFNAAAEAMFGCPAAEAIGQPVERFIPERFRAAHHGHLLRFGRTGDTQRAAGQFVRISGLRANGEEFPLEASISRTHLNGHVIFTIVHRDVTERVRGEEARVHLEAQLRLAQKMEALGTLAGGIAHDFNNILGAIIGNTELARQDVDPSHPAVESLNEIRKASLRAKDLVQRILAFSSEQLQPRSVISLRPVVEESVMLLRATLPAGVGIITGFDADTPTVLADPTLIHQVLMNLCTNAWHALEGHAGRIDIRLDGVALDAEASGAAATLRPGHFARLSVTDTGTGMDAGTVERIFDPFFTTKPVDQGTGLGLSVVHGIMKAHDGAIVVTSQLGSGTTFHLYFPAAEAPEPTAAPGRAAVKPPPAAGGQHVLYLDDEESLVLLVTRTLERLGYQVSGYTQAAAALAAVRTDPTQFDLVVTDLNMPGTSGLEVAREVARLRPDLPVVLASGYITEELRRQVAETGVRQVIYKPNTVEELCAVVQHLTGEPKPPARPGEGHGNDSRSR